MSVASAGDVNGDGFEEVVVGAPRFGRQGAGKAFLYPGGPSCLALSPGWTSTGDDQAGSQFGFSVASAGDVDGDGFDDILVGAFLYDTLARDEGRAYLFLGSPSGLGAVPTWTSSGDDMSFAGFGRSVSSAGDVNQDGFDDAVIGAYHFTTGTSPVGGHEGKAYVYLGGPGGLSPAPVWSSSGDDVSGDNFGLSVGFAGDVNGDGFDDVIVGAPSTDFFSATIIGKAFVFLGGLGGPGDSPGWRSRGDARAISVFGGSVASAGDVNGDGYDDILVGASGIHVFAGKAYLYLGGVSGPSSIPDWTSSGDAVVDANFGASVASAGDVNGDGFSDVIVGALTFPTGAGQVGKAYVFLGEASGLSDVPVWTSLGDDQAGSWFGVSVASAGDVDGDLLPEVLVGASIQSGFEA